MKRVLIAMVLAFSFNVFAETLPPADAQLIASAGIPLYPQGTFVYGNQDVGFRFVSSETPQDVQTWYRGQLPKWSLFNQYGGWILHDGAADSGMGAIMSSNQVSVQYNENLPQWHSLDRNMTTEIVIMIVK